jgi:DNA-binding beta-propeller fold protein YncE
MARLETSPSASASDRNTAGGRLFFLDVSGGRIVAANPDGSDQRALMTGLTQIPDGIVVDADAGYLYWTNMGVPHLNDGSIERVDLDGKNRRVIVPKGGTHTPKQLHLEKASGKLYWSDREGMRVMRANLDGSSIETLVQTGDPDADRGDQTKWCVGITVDPKRGQIYWTQKGPDNGEKGGLFRANLEIPKGQTAANRTDIETWFDRLPEPIDLELDLENRVLYWTDRGDPPRGNTVSRASIDVPRGQTPEIVFDHLMEGIGIALDVPGNRMFMTDLAGSVYTAKLDGSDKRPVLMAQGNLTGIAYVESR